MKSNEKTDQINFRFNDYVLNFLKAQSVRGNFRPIADKKIIEIFENNRFLT